MNGLIAQFALVDEEIVDHLSNFGGPVGVTGRNCGLGLREFGLNELGNGGLAGPVESFEDNELAFVHGE